MIGRADIAGGVLDGLQAAAHQLLMATRAGTTGYSREVQRRLMILNMMAYLIAFFSVVYATLFALYDYAT